MLRSTRTSLLLAAPFCVLAAVTPWLKVNVESSVPYGIYRMASVPTPLQRGMLVSVPTPSVIRPWHPWYIPLLKPIAGLPGDQVCVLSVGMWINGEPYGLVYARAHGQPLPRLRGCYAVPDGHVWLATKTRQTLDSRYIGPISIKDIIAMALPVWVWR